MRRRALLSLVGTASLGGLAGCPAVSPMLTASTVESTDIEARDRICTDSPAESATIRSGSDERTTILVTGSIAVPRIRDTLFVDAQNGDGIRNRDDSDIEVQIDFAPSDPQAKTDVPACDGQIDYRAEIAVTAPPDEVIVRHVVEDENSFSLKTVATRSISRYAHQPTRIR